MFWRKGTYDFIQPEEIEIESKLQFTGSKDLSEGSCAFVQNITDERVVIHWHDKTDPTKLISTQELNQPMFINTAHPVTLKNLGDKSAVVKYVDLNTVIENYTGI
jgi:hypothetical protein